VSVILFSNLNLVSTLFVALLSPFFVFPRPFIRQYMAYWVKRCALPKRLDMTSVVFPPLYHDGVLPSLKKYVAIEAVALAFSFSDT
jgi:hypothetical protein